MRKEKCCFVFAADRGWYSGVVIRGERERKSALFSQIKSFVTGFQRIDQSFFADSPTLAEPQYFVAIASFFEIQGELANFGNSCKTLS